MATGDVRKWIGAGTPDRPRDGRCGRAAVRQDALRRGAGVPDRRRAARPRRSRPLRRRGPLARLDHLSRCRAGAAVCRTRRYLPFVPDRAGVLVRTPLVDAAPGVWRRFAPGLHLGGGHPRRRASHRLASPRRGGARSGAGVVVDGDRHPGAHRGASFRPADRAIGSLRPDLPGLDGRADSARRRAARKWCERTGSLALVGGGGGGRGRCHHPCRPILAAADGAADRRHRQPRAGGRDSPVPRYRHCGADGRGRAVAGTRRLPRRTAAWRD